jgi:NADH-quinone oxidoreductase subunit K
MLDYQLLNHSLFVAVVLFALGVVGLVARRNLVTALISSAVSLQGVVLAFSAFSTFHANASGALFSIVVVIIIAAQAAIGIALSVAFVRDERSLDVSRRNALGEGRAEIARQESHAILETGNTLAGAPRSASPCALPAGDGAAEGAAD